MWRFMAIIFTGNSSQLCTERDGLKGSESNTNSPLNKLEYFLILSCHMNNWKQKTMLLIILSLKGEVQ